MGKAISKARTAESRAPVRAKASATKPVSRGKTLIEIKRAYDPPAASDGLRILIDRLWPRGVTKQALKLDSWAKQLSPSNELRKWYEHDPAKFPEFRKRYAAELAAQGEALAEMRAAVKGRTVTLLTGSKALELSDAIVLRDLLLS